MSGCLYLKIKKSSFIEHLKELSDAADKTNKNK